MYTTAMPVLAVKPDVCRPKYAGNTIVDGVAASNFGHYLHLDAMGSEATRHAAGLATATRPATSFCNAL